MTDNIERESFTFAELYIGEIPFTTIDAGYGI